MNTHLFVLASGARGGPRVGVLAARGCTSPAAAPKRAGGPALANLVKPKTVTFSVAFLRARQALDAGSGAVMLGLVGRLALKRE